LRVVHILNHRHELFQLTANCSNNLFRRFSQKCSDRLIGRARIQHEILMEVSPEKLL